MPFINSQCADKLWSVDFAVELVEFEVNFLSNCGSKDFFVGGGGSEDDFRLVNYSFSL